MRESRGALWRSVARSSMWLGGARRSLGRFGGARRGAWGPGFAEYRVQKLLPWRQFLHTLMADSASRGRWWLVWPPGKVCVSAGRLCWCAAAAGDIYPVANIPVRLVRGELRYIAIGEAAGACRARQKETTVEAEHVTDGVSGTDVVAGGAGATEAGAAGTAGDGGGAGGPGAAGTAGDGGGAGARGRGPGPRGLGTGLWLGRAGWAGCGRRIRSGMRRLGSCRTRSRRGGWTTRSSTSGCGRP